MGFCVNNQRVYIGWQVFSTIISNANSYINNDTSIWTPGQRTILSGFISALIGNFRTSTFNGLVVPPAGDSWQNNPALQNLFNKIRGAVAKGNFLGGDHGVYWYIINPFNPQPALPATDLVPIARFFTAVAVFWGEYTNGDIAVNYLVQTDFVNYAFSNGLVPPSFDYPSIVEFINSTARINFVEIPMTIAPCEMILALTPFLLEAGRIVELLPNLPPTECEVITGDGSFILVNGGVYLTLNDGRDNSLTNIRPVLNDDLINPILLTRVGRPCDEDDCQERGRPRRRRRVRRARCGRCRDVRCGGGCNKGGDVEIGQEEDEWEDIPNSDEETTLVSNYQYEKGSPERRAAFRLKLGVKERCDSPVRRRSRRARRRSISSCSESSSSSESIVSEEECGYRTNKVQCSGACGGQCGGGCGIGWGNQWSGGNRGIGGVDALIDSPYTIFRRHRRPKTIFQYLQKILDRVDAILCIGKNGNAY